MIRLVVATLFLSAVSTACSSSGGDAATNPTSAQSSTSAESSTSAHSAVTLAGSDFPAICTFLTQTGVLREAATLAAVAQPSQADVDRIAGQLDEVRQVAPTVMQLAITNVTEQVRGLPDGGTTAQIIPDGRLIAGECRARGLDVPETG